MVLEVGLVGNFEHIVKPEHLASSLGSGDVTVFSTPSLIALSGNHHQLNPIFTNFLIKQYL